MCGIIGYTGGENTLPILLNGLERLEYRGYDSAGIALVSASGDVNVEKCIGRISRLRELVSGRHLYGVTGIGHTRWATHGAPKKENAHPHSDCTGKINIVHNGIIENFMELKAALAGKGHRFSSETDSEVIAHLVEEELKAGCGLEEACRAAFAGIKGSFAAGVISAEEPGKIIGMRLNSPLVVGIGAGENFIASDIPAIMGRTRRVVYLNDYEMAVLCADGVDIKDAEGRPISYKVKDIDLDIGRAEKGGFETFMLKEVYEQPKVIEGLLLRYTDEKTARVNFESPGLSPSILSGVQKLCITACGTAFHAGVVGRYLIEHFTSVPVEIDLASEFRYRRPKLDRGTFVMSVSQSGETADTIAGIREAKRQGCYLLSICNVPGSTIDRESDGVIYTYAGPEIGVASTKAYTAQITAFCIFTLYMAEIKGWIPEELALRMLNELKTLPGKIRKVLDKKDIIKECAYKYHKAQSTLYLGRGFNYPTALEGALKNKEISYIHAEGYAAGEMKHGPIALIDKDMPVICICTKGDFYDKMLSNIREVEARNGRIIAVATEGDEYIKDIAEDVIYVPQTQDEFSPLINAVPLQLFAYYTASARGCDIDKPRNLAKSVTVE